MVSVQEWLRRTDGKSSPRGAQKADGNLLSALRSNISKVLTNKCSFLPRERLRGRNSFSDVFRNGRIVSRGSMTLHYLTKAEALISSAPIQVGFTVTKPTNKVQRNYLKRVLRELARNQKLRIQSYNIQAQSSLMIIFNVDNRKIHRSTAFEALRGDFHRLLDKFLSDQD